MTLYSEFNFAILKFGGRSRYCRQVSWILSQFSRLSNCLIPSVEYLTLLEFYHFSGPWQELVLVKWTGKIGKSAALWIFHYHLREITLSQCQFRNQKKHPSDSRSRGMIPELRRLRSLVKYPIAQKARHVMQGHCGHVTGGIRNI